MQNSNPNIYGDYVNLMQGMSALSISSAVSSSAAAAAAAASTTPSSAVATQPPSVPKRPRARRCLFPEMVEANPFFYPTVQTWMKLGRQWSFVISAEQAAKINSAILRAIEHMNETKSKNTWMPFDENLIISPAGAVYWRIAPLTGANKETQWKIIEACSTRNFPPNSLQVLHFKPTDKELQLCQHLGQPNMISHGLFSLTSVGDALVSRYMQDGCLEDYIGANPIRLAEKISFSFQVALAVKFLHENGVAHRDLSTRNIIKHGSQINLCDYGSACFLSEENPGGLIPLRTSATEVLLQHDSKDWAVADLYALGIVYHCLFGSTKCDDLFKSSAFCFGLTPQPENFRMFCNKRSQIELWPGRSILATDIEPLITKLLHESPTERPSLDSVISILRNRTIATIDQKV